MFAFCEQILNGLAPLKRLTSKIRGDAEKLIPPVLIFNRSLNVTSRTFPIFLLLILMDMSFCQSGEDFRSKQPLQKRCGWGFYLWPSHPSPCNTSMPWIILSAGSFLCAWLGLNPRTQPWGKGVTELYGFVCKNKATGYISVYYNVASLDKANYLSPTTIEKFTLLIILHCGEKTCFKLIPRGSADGDSLALYLEVLSLFHIYLAFANICLWLSHLAKLYFLVWSALSELEVFELYFLSLCLCTDT